MSCCGDPGDCGASATCRHVDGKDNYCAGHPLPDAVEDGCFDNVGNPKTHDERTPSTHALDIALEASTLVLHKYVRGQQEHGGELWRKTGLIDKAIEEALDQVIYLLTLREQLSCAGVELGDLDE